MPEPRSGVIRLRRGAIMVAKQYPEKQEPRRTASTSDETIDVEGLLKSRRREGREVRRAVLFVHGFTGDQDATWTNRGTVLNSTPCCSKIQI